MNDESTSKVDFSVLMAVYSKDDPEHFREAIASVLANTLQPKRFVIVCDGPLTDSLEKILEEFKVIEHLLIIRCALNKGLSSALNEGLRHIDSSWVARADADDINKENRFSVQYKMMNESLDIFGSNITEFSDEGETYQRIVPSQHSEIVEFLKLRSPFNHMTVCFRRSLVLEAGGYPELNLKEDYSLWISLISKGARCANIRESLVLARAGGELYKRRGGWKYAKTEIALQKQLVFAGLKSPVMGVAHGITRALIFLLPSYCRKFIYSKFMRETT